MAECNFMVCDLARYVWEITADSLFKLFYGLAETNCQTLLEDVCEVLNHEMLGIFLVSPRKMVAKTPSEDPVSYTHLTLPTMFEV